MITIVMITMTRGKAAKAALKVNLAQVPRVMGHYMGLSMRLDRVRHYLTRIWHLRQFRV